MEGVKSNLEITNLISRTFFFQKFDIVNFLFFYKESFND